ncbi:MAG: hypothetical protein NTY36_04575 [Deltaproteobacteria bacterium]|nr:hypothetical protein [Deltaproteobacteria bacterium]
MKDKFFRPAIIWFGIWLAIFFSVSLIGSWQTKLYWQDDVTRSRGLEILTIRTILPYALVYLEEQNQPDLLQKIFDADFGPYALVLTDRAGEVKYAPRSWPAGKIAPDLLKGKEFFYLLRDRAFRISLAGPYDRSKDPVAGGAAKGDTEALGLLYLVPKETAAWQWSATWAYWNIFTPAKTVLAFSLLSYALVLVGFASICAITARFQRHFQEVQERQHEAELETRELRIQVLESKIKSADLRLQLLDRNLEKAQTRLNEAEGTITEMESSIQYESSRNDELQENLRQAEAEKDEALISIQDIEQDRERITKELKELEALREVEEMNYPETSRERTRRPKEFLWLNQVYQNLQFSRRALQNIIDLQNSPDIFPSLPDALTTLNNSSVESLLNGGAIPSRSAGRYTQPLAHHYGDLWEYRFSKDGRMFFGLSQSRTWNIDTILLKRKFSLNRHKYEKYLEQTLGKDNDDLTSRD